MRKVLIAHFYFKSGAFFECIVAFSMEGGMIK
jgi:hypothetical protein